MIGTPPSTGLYFIFNGTVYLPGDILSITNIGSIGYSGHIGSSLACVTTNINTQCCRRSDGGAVGEWHFPDGSILPRRLLGGAFTRSGHPQRINLNNEYNRTTPTGLYSCQIPVNSSDTVVAGIYLVWNGK